MLLAGVCLAAGAAHGQDASWVGSGPAPADWNTAANWSPSTVPTGTATFTSSGTTTTQIETSAPSAINTLQFNAGAPAYSFSFSQVLTVTGVGFTGNSGVATMTAGSLNFLNSSTAGGATVSGGTVEFHNTSTAGNAHVAPTGPFFFPSNISMRFFDGSTAGNATFGCLPSPPNACFGANVSFFNTSSASSATFDRANLTFHDTSTAGNAVITSTFQNGPLQFLDASTAGNANITNSQAGRVVFENSSSAGNAILTNTATLEFGDSSSAGNATIAQNGGVTRFRDSSSAGNAIIMNNSFGVFFLGTSTAGNATITTNNGVQVGFFNNSTGGQARLITNAGGTVDFLGTGPAGDGQVTAGSLEGAGTYILRSNTLTVGGNNLSTTVSGIIMDGDDPVRTGGSMVKVGAGVFTLSGTNTYTGATTINAGALIVDGSIASSSGVTVNAGGTLGGTGTVGNTTINGGTLSPGNSIGTLTVQGNLVLTAAASYLVEVSPTAADRTNVTGTAALAGTVSALFASGTYITRTYTILSAAGGRSGTFGSLTTAGLPAGFAASLSYTSTDAIVNLVATLGASGLSINQQNVAGALNNFFNNGGALPANFLPIFNLTGSNLGNALSQLSGEAATGGQQVGFQMTNQFLGLMLDPFVDGRSGVAGAGGPALGFAPEREDLPEDITLAYSSVLKAPPAKAPSVEQRWSAWGGAYGGSNRTSGDPTVVGSHDLSARAAGFAAGLDYHLAPNTVVGVALAGGGTNWSLANGLGGGKSDAFQAGVYGATRRGPAYLAAALSYTNHWMSTDRFAFAGDHLTASFNAQSIGARVESGYRFATIFGGVTPYAAVQAQNFRTPSYSETDVNGGGFALAYNGRIGTDTRSVGARFDRLLAVNPNAVLALRARLAWAHDWVSDPTLAAVFQTLPGAGFVVNGATPARDSALASAGTELRLANGVTLLAKFDGEFASRASTYAGTGTMRYPW